MNTYNLHNKSNKEKRNLLKYKKYLIKIKKLLQDMSKCKKMKNIDLNKSDISNAFNIVIYDIEYEILKFNCSNLTNKAYKIHQKIK